MITETTTGFPDRDKFLAVKTLEANELTLGDSGTYFQFDTKAVIQAEKEYAFIVLCDDATGSVRVAEMGKAAQKRSGGRQTWLTSQAYSVGVMFTSSNNSTWTPFQFKDMEFELNKCVYSPVRVLDELPPISVIDACDVMLLSEAELEPGTSVEYYITIFKDNIGGTEYTFQAFPLEHYSLEQELKYTGDIYLTVILSTTDISRSPRLDPSIQIAIGSVDVNDEESRNGFVNTPFDYRADKASLIHLDYTFTAALGGSSGNDITVAFINGGSVNIDLNVVVTNTDIVVNLGTDGSAVLNSTDSEVYNLLLNDFDVRELIDIELNGDGTGLATSFIETSLTNGLGPNDIISDYISDFFYWEPTDGKIQVYLDRYHVPSVTDIRIYYDKANLMPTDENYAGADWVEIEYVGSKPLKGNWEEALYESPVFTARPDTARTRIMITLGSNSILTRPVCGNLRASIHAITP